MTQYGALSADESTDTAGQQISPHQPLWRTRLGHLLESQALHWTILGLTLLDTVCVLIQILYTFAHECGNDIGSAMLKGPDTIWVVAFEMAEVMTVFITCLFVMECVLNMVAFGPRYYLPGWSHWKLHVFDILVVGSTFVLEVVLHGKEREISGLLILFRLWRIVKVVDAVVKSISYSNEERLKELTEELAHVRTAYAELEKLSERQITGTQQLHPLDQY